MAIATGKQNVALNVAPLVAEYQCSDGPPIPFRGQMMAEQTIVVMNDDAMIVELLHDILLDAGYTQLVDLARRDAQQVLRETQPALILLDIHEAWPSLGWRRLDELRSDAATAHTPIVITTTNPSLFQNQYGWLRQQGCTVLAMPLAIDGLLATVRSVVGAPLSENACAA
jgi:CheY-like chemotaxis protein